MANFIPVMKTLISTCFISMLLFTQTPLGQLLKLPVLVHHYNDHNKQSGLSLIQFLHIHYASDHTDDDDQAEDDQLPFKTIELQSIGFAIMPVTIKPGFVYNTNESNKVVLPHFY